MFADYASFCWDLTANVLVLLLIVERGQAVVGVARQWRSEREASGIPKVPLTGEKDAKL